ncbi:uncharacterized protein LOC100181115 [Ciona intestinalis]
MMDNPAYASKIEIGRKHTMYKKDVLPKHLTREKSNSFDVDNAVKLQLENVKTLKQDVQKSRQKVVQAIEKILSGDTYQYECCAEFGQDFLEDMLNSITTEESKLRNQVLGEQESVEMFKCAVSESQVSPTHLEAARMKRDEITQNLCVIVEEREKVFSALEVLHAVSPTKPNKVDLTLKNELKASVLKLKSEYTCANESLKDELDKLKTYTNWQRTPALMIKQLNAPTHTKSTPNLSSI